MSTVQLKGVLTLSKQMDTASDPDDGSAAPDQLFFYNVSPTGNEKCPQFSLLCPPGGLLGSFAKAILHFEAVKADIVTAVYAPETAYIYLYADDVDWMENLPQLWEVKEEGK
ncbi:hypothetical protein H0H92_012073 [Tricholoma furcatifolium]|nr:hypothetical protein H0H92_012073 [Tricholoma furcatifolium]